ncbi:MAG TPA: diguanylate cyclase, partial [Syntrophales bacterium]|nr:diguanylate cyclase [Syntrophales bacterium]
DIINNRLHDQLDIHNAREGRNYTISISVGMAYCDPEKPCSLDELMSRADSLMYGKKKTKHL